MAEEEIELAKRKYLKKLSDDLSELLVFHENPGGLLEVDEAGRSWENVVEHCLLEAARVRKIAEKVGLSQQKTEELVAGATLHDFYKRREKEAMDQDRKQGGSGREGSEKSKRESTQYLLQAGIDPFVVRLTNIVGGAPAELYEIKKILDQGSISEEELACLIIHYVDGYTKNAEWVELASGQPLENDIDRRGRSSVQRYGEMERAEALKYQDDPLIRGRLAPEVDAELNHQIEKRLLAIIEEKTGQRIAPLFLPEYIDKEIQEEAVRL